MDYKKIDHIAIAVPDLNAAIDLYKDLLNTNPAHIEEIEDQQVKVAFFQMGESGIELLCPTAAESSISKFLEKKNQGGLHHICFEVDNIEEQLEKLKAKGVQLIDSKPRIGAHGKKIAFIHPKSTNGVLIELCQKQKN